MTVSDLLHEHRHPMILAYIARETGMKRREVELEIQRLRLEGLPIVSGPDGVKLSRDPKEVRECAGRLLHRLSVQAQTAHALERTATLMEGNRQQELGLA